MDHKTVEEYVLSMPGAGLEYPFGEGVAVYKVMVGSGAVDGNGVSPEAGGGANSDAGGRANSDAGGRSKMFALIAEKSEPVRLSLKCDPQLAVVLREKYETVLEGYHLNKKHWNTILLTGQLPWEEVQGLIRHSYQLVAGTAIAGEGDTPVTA